MRVGDHCSRAVRKNRLFKLCRCDHRAFEMDVSVNKSGTDIFAGHILFTHTLIAADAGDHAVCDRDITGLDTLRKYVYNVGIFQDKICFLSAVCHIDDLFVHCLFHDDNHSFLKP